MSFLMMVVLSGSGSIQLSMLVRVMNSWRLELQVEIKSLANPNGRKGDNWWIGGGIHGSHRDGDDRRRGEGGLELVGRRKS